MVRCWLDSQVLPELGTLLLDNIKTRLRSEIHALQDAILSGDLTEAARKAHSIKGWSGSYKMDSIASVMTRMDSMMAEGPVDRLVLRRLTFELGEMVGRIPNRWR